MMVELKGKIWAVEVPEGAINFTVDMGYLIYKVPNYKAWVTDDILADYGKLQKHLDKHSGDDDYKTCGNPLPPSTWRFLFTTKTATEEDAKKVVKRTHPGGFGRSGEEFKNYIKESPVCYSALESIASLLRSKGLDPNKNYALIEKQSSDE